jgi:predicted dehydrogenase
MNGGMDHNVTSPALHPIRVGLVGANPDRGWGSGVHRRVIEQLPGFELSAVCTTRAQSAEEAARRFGARHAFTDAAALASSPDVDLVSVCVLAPQHYAITRAALLSGKHVYCEWPLALTLDQAEELAALAADRGVKAMIGLHLRGSPALRYAADLIAQGFVGTLFGVALQVRVFGPMMGAMATRSGGTTLLSIYGGHLLDAVDHYFGGIADLAARAAVHLPPIDETGAAIARDAADHLLIQGSLQEGALFSVDLAGASLAGLGSSWRIDGSEGTLILSSADPTLPAIEALSLQGARAGEEMRAMPIPRQYDCDAIPAEPDRYFAYPGSDASRAALVSIGNLYGQLGRAIRSDDPIEPDFHRAVQVQRLLARIDRTAAGQVTPFIGVDV